MLKFAEIPKGLSRIILLLIQTCFKTHCNVTSSSYFPIIFLLCGVLIYFRCYLFCCKMFRCFTWEIKNILLYKKKFAYKTFELIWATYPFSYYLLFHDGGRCHIETSPLICRAMEIFYSFVFSISSDSFHPLLLFQRHRYL